METTAGYTMSMFCSSEFLILQLTAYIAARSSPGSRTPPPPLSETHPIVSTQILSFASWAARSISCHHQILELPTASNQESSVTLIYLRSTYLTHRLHSLASHYLVDLFWKINHLKISRFFPVSHPRVMAKGKTRWI